MSNADAPGGSNQREGLRLVVRRRILATPERLFDAWTDPQQLLRWWGPGSVECVGAEVDLRVSGRYRIGNRFPDGRVAWISGEFLSIDRPRELVYTWRLDAPAESGSERVSVRFEARDGATDVIVTHERVRDDAARRGHEQGWIGCLDGLAAYLRS